MSASGEPTLLPGALNGYGVVHFDGVDDALGRTGFSGLPTGGGARSVFMYARYNQADTSTGGWVGFAYGTPKRNQVFGLALTPDGTLGVQGWGGANDVESSPPTNGVGEWLIQAAIYQNGTLSQYKDGASIGTTSHSFATGTGSIRLGEEISLDKNLDMDVVEVIVYDRALNETERQQVEDYLAAKYQGTPSNQAPVVSVGGDQTITLPAGAVLNATVTDDGLPGGGVTLTWSQQSGPVGGTAVFANAAAEDTTVSFDVAGSYVLRLTADDGEQSGSDELTVTVEDAPLGNTAPVVSITSPTSGESFTAGDPSVSFAWYGDGR